MTPVRCGLLFSGLFFIQFFTIIGLKCIIYLSCEGLILLLLCLKITSMLTFSNSPFFARTCLISFFMCVSVCIYVHECMHNYINLCSLLKIPSKYYYILCIPLPGYFRYLRVLLNAKVPSSLEPSTVPPTPMAAAIRDLVMNPLYFSSQSSSGEESAFTANDR